MSEHTPTNSLQRPQHTRFTSAAHPPQGRSAAAPAPLPRDSACKIGSVPCVHPPIALRPTLILANGTVAHRPPHRDRCAKLKKPRRVMLLVKAGPVVDAFIEQCVSVCVQRASSKRPRERIAKGGRGSREEGLILISRGRAALHSVRLLGTGLNVLAHTISCSIRQSPLPP